MDDNLSDNNDDNSRKVDEDQFNIKSTNNQMNEEESPEILAKNINMKWSSIF